jgi:hypothetical protein
MRRHRCKKPHKVKEKISIPDEVNLDSQNPGRKKERALSLDPDPL